jgi:hypothetical protein
VIGSGGLTTTIHAQEIDVTLTKSQSVKIIQDLIACDYIQKEVKIILNTLKTKDQMLAVRQLQIGEMSNEIDKRDDIIERLNNEYELKAQMNDNLQKQLLRSDRRRKANKWLYFGLGVGVGYLVGR